MVSRQHLVFAGGDARMLEVIRVLHEEGANVTLVGFDGASDLPASITHADSVAEGFSGADAVIVPMSGIDDEGRVDTRFSSRPVVIQERDLRSLRPGTFVFTGIARPRFESSCHRLDLKLVKLMDLDDVAILNSIPTAEGTIAMAMDLMDITIHGCQAVVVGFGRCGVTLARNLSALGAHVKAVARRPSDLARIAEMGLHPVSISELRSAVKDADLVVNTIPHPILTAPVLDAMPVECVVIDIASKPGGTDFDHASSRGITAKLAPSLPGLVAPKTAGRILATTIGRVLRDAADHSL